MNKLFFSFVIGIFIVSFSMIFLVNCKFLNTYSNRGTEHINSKEKNETYFFINESKENIGIPHEDSNDDKNDEIEDLKYEIIEL